MLNCDLSGVPRADLSLKLGVNGQLYHEIHFSVEATFYSAEIKFELMCQGTDTFTIIVVIFVASQICRERKKTRFSVQFPSPFFADIRITKLTFTFYFLGKKYGTVTANWVDM